MALYARLNDAEQFIGLAEFTDEQYAAFVANGKSRLVRPWIPVLMPTPNASQVVEPAAPIIAPESVTQAWNLRAKTAEELNADAVETERQALALIVANLAASVAAPDVSGAAGERILKLEARMQRVERICLWILRRFT
jgi:hypothetical protein